MPRGAKIKADSVKVGEKARGGFAEAASDDLSTVDKGKDFVKAGETA